MRRTKWPPRRRWSGHLGHTAGVSSRGPAVDPAGDSIGGPAGDPAGVSYGGPAGDPAGVSSGGPAGDPADVSSGGPAGDPAGVSAGDRAGFPARFCAGDLAEVRAGAPAGIRAGALATGLIAVGLLAACATDGDAVTTGSASSSGSTVTGDVMVFAAASLTDAFTEIGTAFMDAHPTATVTFSFSASSDLVIQIGEGAPADVFASADQATMTRLVDVGENASEPVVFAASRAEIIVAPGNPRGITRIADLADDELIVIACAPSAPCGRYAQQVLSNAGVTVTFRSLEENVRAVVAKVLLGEADAGIVYASDVRAAGDDVDGVPIPADINVVAEYPITTLRDAPNPSGARAFVDFVRSDEAQAILASYGFVSP